MVFKKMFFCFFCFNYHSHNVLSVFFFHFWVIIIIFRFQIWVSFILKRVELFHLKVSPGAVEEIQKISFVFFSNGRRFGFLF
jgi:hypothetical protein